MNNQRAEKDRLSTNARGFFPTWPRSNRKRAVGIGHTHTWVGWVLKVMHHLRELDIEPMRLIMVTATTLISDLTSAEAYEALVSGRKQERQFRIDPIWIDDINYLNMENLYQLGYFAQKLAAAEISMDDKIEQMADAMRELNSEQMAVIIEDSTEEMVDVEQSKEVLTSAEA